MQMVKSKEADLVAATLLYIARCVGEGDRAALAALDVSATEAEAVTNLTVADLQLVDSLHGHCLDIRFNRTAFWPLLSRIQRGREREMEIDQLIAADAPLDMMSNLYGLTARDFSHKRKRLKKDSVGGRPLLPDKRAENALFEQWREVVRGKGTEELDGSDYIELSGATGLSLKAIWQLTQKWCSYGPIQ